MNITLLGTGAYGLAIASAIAKNKHKVCMWTENEEKYKEWKKTRQLKSIMPEFNMPQNIIVTNDIKEAATKTDVIFITCASKYVGSVCESIKPYFKKDTPICIASKGIEEKSCKLLSRVVKDHLDTKNLSVVSGPTFAIDMINGEPVALALAGKNKYTRNLISDIMSSGTLKLRKSNDMIGVQICGSVKNIIAIASGILGGLGYSESTRAFLINESLHDIKNLIKFLKGKPKTVLSFAGVGDLLMTCMSTKSRNYSFGYVIGSSNNKEKIEEFLSNNTVEGYFTLKTVVTLLDRKNIEIELIYLINDIVDGKKDPKELATFLINKK